MKIPKMLVITPYAMDANSFWRCVGPLSYMDHHGLIRMTLSGPKDLIAWSDLMQYDLLFMHRPCRPDDVTIMQIAYNLGIPVWADFDDWLFGIPSWNPSEGIYNANATQMRMAQCLACADVVSVSTAELYNHYSKVNPNVVIIPNAYRSDLFPYRTLEMSPRGNHAIWRGTNTHDGDLLSVRDGFIRMDHKIHFHGKPSWLLLSGMRKENYEIRPAADVIMYFKVIYDSAPKVFLFPLFDCLFNRCKSNIAYIEALHSGAICVAPDLPEWNREGVVTYRPNDSQSFLDATDQVFALGDEERDEIVAKAFDSMIADYDITKITEIRKQVILQLMSKIIVKKNPFDNHIALTSLMYLQGVLNGAKATDQKPTSEMGIS